MCSNILLRSNYIVIKEHSLVVERHEGICTLDEIIAFSKSQVADPDYSAGHTSIVDIRDLKIDASYFDVKAFADFCQQYTSGVVARRTAFITKTPEQVANIILFNSMHADSPQFLTVVSTIGAAVSWVGCDLVADVVAEALQNLKMKTSTI